MRIFRFSKSVGLVAAFTLLLASAPASADFLDDLFGGGESAAPPPAPVRARPQRKAREGFSIRSLDERKSARVAKDKKDEDEDAGHGPYVAGSRPVRAALCASPGAAKVDNATAYLRDETLRAGDSVVTDGAIVVFKGNRGCPHGASDFVSVARADLPKVKRNALAALEQSMRSPQRSFSIEDDQPKVAGHDLH